MDSFKVSVIIPVYNAGKFVRNAVESAVKLEEVYEVILVDDGYPDNGLQVCQELVKENSKVRLFRHPNGENRGPGASRNLGIQQSRCDYIAFLDADDWYYPNRFVKDKILFESDKTIDGVYGCTQSVVDKDGVLEPIEEFSTVSGIFTTLELTLGWLSGTIGAFTTNAITVRKSLFDRTGYFDTTLTLHQDSHLYYRFLWYGNIVAGEINKPIAVRRKHPDNRVAKTDVASKHKYYRKLFESYELVENPDRQVYRRLLNRYVSTYAKGKGKLMANLTRLFFLISKPKRIFKFI